VTAKLVSHTQVIQKVSSDGLLKKKQKKQTRLYLQTIDIAI
jgi:hypothetical protein